MEYNKYHKINDKKILHKKGKRWITLSIGIMAMLGGTFLAKDSVHADANNNRNNQQTQATKQNNNQKTNLVQQHNTQPTQAKQQSNEQSTKNISAQASVLHKAIVNNAARSAMQNANNIHNKKMKLGASNSLFTTSNMPTPEQAQQRYNYLSKYEDSSDNMYLVKPDITHGIPGTINPTYAQHVIDWINYARWLNGLKPVQNSAKLDNYAQYGADDCDKLGYIKHGLGGMSKKPNNISVSDWKKGIDATNNSNLSEGYSNEPSSILTSYLVDSGNPGVGHRAWILDPFTLYMGVGQDDDYNDLYVGYKDSDNSDASDNNKIVVTPAQGRYPLSVSDGSSTNRMPWSISASDFSDGFAYDHHINELDDTHPNISVYDNTSNKNVPISDVASDNSDNDWSYNIQNHNDIQPNHSYTITIAGSQIPDGKFSYTTTLYNLKTSDSYSDSPSDTEPIVEDGKPSKIKSSRSLESTAPTYHKTAKHTTKPKVKKHDQKASSTSEPQVQQTKHTEQRQSMPTHHESLKEYQDSPKNQEIKKEQKQTAKDAIKPSDVLTEQSKQSQTEPTADITQTRTTNTVSNTSEPNYSKSTATGSPISQSNSDDNSQGNQSELPQTGDAKFNEELSAILLSISVSIGAFGKTIDKRKKD